MTIDTPEIAPSSPDPVPPRVPRPSSVLRPPSFVLRRRAALLCALLIIIAIGLDLWGIMWGLPDARHLRSYHPDEWTLIEAAERINPLAGVISPHFFNYGSFYIYLLWAVYAVGQALGLLNAHPSNSVYDPANQAALYLTARCVTVLFSVGTVVLTWRLGTRLFGRTAGWIGGFLLAVTPLFAIHSHYATVDVTATFWVVASALASVHALRPRKRVSAPDGSKPHKRGPRIPAPLVLGAACAGFAGGTKYNAVLVLFACWFAWGWWFHADTAAAAALSDRSEPARVGRFHFIGDLIYGLLVVTLVAFGAFLLCTPGFITDQQRFINDFAFELRHTATGHGFVFSHTAPAFIYHITHSLWIGAGPPLTVVALSGVIFALWRRTRSDLLMAAFALPYYLLIGTAQVKFMRYIIPLLPFLCIWAARLVAAGLERARGASGEPDADKSRSAMERDRVRRWLALVCLAAAGVFAALETAAYDLALARPDVRDRAADWIFANVPPHDSIGMVRSPWFDSPPLIFYNTNMPAADVESREGEWPYQIEITGWDPAKLQQDRPEYFVLTEWQVRYRLRLHRLEPRGTSTDAKAGREAADFMRALGARYQRVATFRSPPAIGPLVFRRGFVPEDWLYPDPEIWIYRRT
ncbi:MAG TPA: glycosyltransferase family 39 protein [Armatimonadota bacterium]|nr:glycosyltransferase family 39 protein [Armatimonadota bacterium]